ncbi:hypothetical protein FF38_12918 [Lucilia cuprina]|uniref:Zinc finger protein 830 n=1 Tax=Lucilia cuprina TaxID=7375 RepID=A0A0L0CJ58_LUCCU|nr:Zinc finger protein 830 [Lucilia cuprina]KNC32286.1 hypothetical protein FF38_12918 [Lucilia cuprina]
MYIKHLQLVFFNFYFTYDSKGNMICVICNSLIKSVAIWKVHVNSKLHKTNLEEAKKIMCTKVLDKPLEKKICRKKESNTPLHLNKLIEETSTTNKKEILSSKLSTTVLIESSDLLPELFFDDPIVDAKIRNVEYKNGQDDEWEKFQREIKEESMTSNKLISGEQINAAVEREITEISEQMYQWSKVIDLENKLNKINKREKRKDELEDTDEDSSENELINESLDWRTKKIW